MIRRPLTIPLTGLIAGIVIGNYAPIPFYISLISFILTFIFIIISFRNQFWKLGIFFIFSSALIIGVLNINKQNFLNASDNHISKYINSGRKTVEAIVEESPASYPDKNILTVRCIRLMEDGVYSPVKGRIRLVTPSGITFSYGDLIRFSSNLKKITGFKNPGGFDYEYYLKRQGIYATAYIPDNSRIILLRKKAAIPIRHHIESFRMYLKQIIFDNVPSPQREIIEAMSIGNQSGIPPEIRENFNKTGTAHILSISGLHVGVVAAATFFIINFLLKFSEYLMLKFNTFKISAALAFLLVFIYSLIAGMNFTVIRAALMAMAFLFALILEKNKDIYNALALAGLLILIISPEALFDISFQLSFTAVSSIIFIVPRLGKMLSPQFSLYHGWIQVVSRYFYTSIVVCLAATAGTLPLIVFYFNRVSLITVIANLLIVPLLGSFTLVIILLFMITAYPIPFLACYFLKTASFCVDLSLNIINKLASFSWSSIVLTKPTIPEIAVFYLLVTVLIIFIDAGDKVKKNDIGSFRRKKQILKYLIISIVIFFAADASYLSIKDKLTRSLKITALDVGQGSSILVRLPGGENVLIDGGGFTDSSFDTGRSVIAPYLYHERINKIDTVILTHPHPDHLNGLFYILANFNVREFWSAGVTTDDDDQKKLQEILAEHKITPVIVNRNCRKKKNGVEFNFFWPPANNNISQNKLSDKDINNLSLVFQIKFENRSFLFTGDIGSDIENALVGMEQILRSDLLFIPHHGSDRSSSPQFIKTVACRYGIISAGENNSFRHPHLLTLEHYKMQNVQIFRTDKDGAIIVTTDGTNMFTESYIKHR